MKRHPGNILARPSFEEIVNFYTGKHFRRMKSCLPAFIIRKIKSWVLSPQGGLYRMLTALLFGLKLIHAQTARFSSKPWRMPAIPIYALTGAAFAIAFVLLLAHWPNPTTPLDVNGLLLSNSDSQQVLAWSEDSPTNSFAADFEIPPELYPIRNITTNSQVVASIAIPGNSNRSDLDNIDIIASLSPANRDLSKSETADSKFPPVNGVNHIVRRGETLWDIAKAYGLECEALEGYNPHIDPRRMQLGQKIFIPGADSAKVIPRKTKMIVPVRNAWVISGFGMRKHPLGGVLRFHRGIDLPADTGTPVRAVMDGVVTEVGWRSSLGRYVRLKHSGGYETVYGHNSKVKVKAGERVKEGRIISLSGSTGRSTGPHLHFEVIKNGKHVDPEQYLPRLSHSRPSKRYVSIKRRRT